jgi:hypothetical protein
VTAGDRGIPGFSPSGGKIARLSAAQCWVAQAKPRRSGRARFGEDQFEQGRDELAAPDVQPGAEVIPECNAQFNASLCQADEGVAAITTDVSMRAAD